MSPPAGEPRRVTVRARGHPLVRATHAKTLELTTEPDITARATCVVGIAPPGALEALAGLRGPVVVTLRAAGRSARVVAVANPAFEGGSRAVIRRSGRRSPETLAVGADKAAADLDRGLVRALAEPGCEVEVVVEVAGASPQATAALLVVPPVLAADPSDGLLRALGSASAVVVLGEPRGAASEAAALAGRAGVPLASGEGPGETARRLERGEAVALVCDPDRPGAAAAEAVREAAAAGVAVRAVPGVAPATAALAAAGLLDVPRALLGAPPSATAARGRQLRAVAALGAAGVWEAPLPRLLPLLADLAAWRPLAPAGVLLDPGGVEEVHLPGPAGELAKAAVDSPARARAMAVVDLRATTAEAGAGTLEAGGLDGEVRDVLAALLDGGVTPHTLARALRRLPGVGGREAYDLVLALKREREATGG